MIVVGFFHWPVGFGLLSTGGVVVMVVGFVVIGVVVEFVVDCQYVPYSVDRPYVMLIALIATPTTTTTSPNTPSSPYPQPSPMPINSLFFPTPISPSIPLTFILNH